jgi:hypothetical protein
VTSLLESIARGAATSALLSIVASFAKGRKELYPKKGNQPQQPGSTKPKMGKLGRMEEMRARTLCFTLADAAPVCLNKADLEGDVAKTSKVAAAEKWQLKHVENWVPSVNVPSTIPPWARFARQTLPLADHPPTRS